MFFPLSSPCVWLTFAVSQSVRVVTHSALGRLIPTPLQSERCSVVFLTLGPFNRGRKHGNQAQKDCTQLEEAARTHSFSAASRAPVSERHLPPATLLIHGLHLLYLRRPLPMTNPPT